METGLMLIFLLFYEYLIDFCLQSRRVAENKSKNVEVLGEHLFTFILLLIPLYLLGFNMSAANSFVCAYIIVHGFVDYFLWKFYRRSAKKRNITKYWEDKEFYDFIGLDRYLHVGSFILFYYIYLI